MFRILLTGGGSGGHVFPLVAIVKQLRQISVDKNIDIKIRYYGPKDIYSSYLVGENIVVKKIWLSKLRRYFSWKNFVDAPKFILSLLQALFKIYWFMPDIAFSKGGPGALAVLLACRFYKIPVLIHESDSVPGLTNGISGRFAKKIEISFESTKNFFSGKNVNLTGNPIRDGILAFRAFDPAGAKERLGFDPNLPLLLIAGGSLGSARINDFILKIIRKVLENFQVAHQVGTANYDEYNNQYQQISQKWPNEIKNRYKIFAFFEKNYGEALAASDMVMARSGSGSIFEIAAFGKPAILIPLLESAQDHQKQNAYEYSKTGAAFVIEEPNMLESVVLGTITKIIDDKSLREKMNKSALAFSKPDAAEAIANDILSFA